MSWEQESYRHSLASRGIRSCGRGLLLTAKGAGNLLATGARGVMDTSQDFEKPIGLRLSENISTSEEQSDEPVSLTLERPSMTNLEVKEEIIELDEVMRGGTFFSGFFRRTMDDINSIVKNIKFAYEDRKPVKLYGLIGVLEGKQALLQDKISILNRLRSKVIGQRLRDVALYDQVKQLEKVDGYLGELKSNLKQVDGEIGIAKIYLKNVEDTFDPIFSRKSLG